ncbi:MAG: anaerobic ribonucleoside-triphosphate reductase activating protein [Telmatospirillum sp.]|nr:anaerobic ribonucleoside-triphosphate reductase activating protein [Telmatospirillum sp.]
MTDIRVGGLARLSTCDWPGQLVATVFCQGCPWDCAYCHNPHLIPAQAPREISWRGILAFLAKRRGLLDGVVFSGGEPTAQGHLREAIEEVRALGFRVGLHTAGSCPDRLADILPLVDWVGFDAKAPFDIYERITSVPGSGARARISLDHLVASKVEADVRTTVHPGLLTPPDIARLTEELTAAGVARHRIQPFRPNGCRADRLPGSSP